MNAFIIYLKSYLEYRLQKVIAGNLWKSTNYSLTTTTIKNTKLAQELEIASAVYGFLTYSEYLQICQFGENGYHNTHSYHSMTDTHSRWGKPLTTLCEKENINTIVEFGCGNGNLGVEIMKYAKQENYELKWSGIDINPKFLRSVKERAQKENLIQYLERLDTSIEYAIPQEKCLVLFSYSLDSIPPEIFINTINKKTFPNTIIGVTIKDTKVKEIFLTEKQLHQTHRSFKNGVYTDDQDNTFDLKAWQLYPYQRAYVPIKAFSVLHDFSQKVVKESLFVIIDEFSLPHSKETTHLCLPKSLLRYDYNREVKNIKQSYLASGTELFYYISYLSTYVSALQSLGLGEISYDEEHVASEVLLEKSKLILSGPPEPLHSRKI